MEFLKRNVFIITCLLAGLASVGLGLVACDSFGSIQKSMEEAAGLGQQLSSAGKAGGRNQVIAPPDIVVQQQNIETMQEAVRVVRDKAVEENRRDLDYLVAGAFPDPTKPDVHAAFVRAYREAVDALPALLGAGGPPSPNDIKAVEQKIQAENEDMGLATNRPVVGQRRQAPRGARRPEAERNRARLDALTREFERRGPTGRDRRAQPKAAGETEPVSEEERLRTDPQRRAEIERAQSIRCYVSNQLTDTFTVVPEALGFTSNPDPCEIWRAQMTLWVQREICKALAAVNDEAVEGLGEGQNADVTALPVKRLVRLAVGDYRMAMGSVERARGAGASPSKSKGTPPPRRTPAGAGKPTAKQRTGGPTAGGQENLQDVLDEATWTGRFSGEDLDVVPVALRLVLDVRYLPRVIDRICRGNYYVPARVSYRQLKRSELTGPHLYGPEPVVEATLVFERYFFPEVYDEKMPLAVREWLGRRPAEKGRTRGRRGTGGRK